MGPLRRRWPALALVIAALARGHGARAAPPKPAVVAQPTEAQQRFQRALELYEEGDLGAARVELSRAYELAPNYKILFNLGQIAFELHDYPASLTAFEKYLAEGGAKIPAERRRQIEADIDKLRGRVATLEIAVGVDRAEVLVDDVAAGMSPLPRPLVLAAGRRKIAVAKVGYQTDVRWVDLAGRDAARIRVDLAETPPPATAAAATTAPPLPTPPRNDPATPSAAPSSAARAGAASDAAAERPLAPVPWLGWTLTGSLVAGAAITGGLALAAARDLRDARGQLGVTRTALDHKQAEVQGLALASDICAGAAVLVGALSLYSTLTRGRETASEGRASLRVTPAVGAIVMSGDF